MGCGVKRLNVEFHFSSASISEIILFLHCLPCARHKHPRQKHIYYIYKKQTIPGIFIFFFLPQFIGELKKLPVPVQVCVQRWNRGCLTIIEGGISHKAEGELQKPSCSFCQWVFPSSCSQQCWWFFLVCSTSLSCWCPWSTASNLYKIVLWEEFQFSLKQHQQLLPLPTILCQLISWMALIVFCVNCNVVQVCTCLCFWLSSALKTQGVWSSSPNAALMLEWELESCLEKLPLLLCGGLLWLYPQINREMKRFARSGFVESEGIID